MNYSIFNSRTIRMTVALSALLFGDSFLYAQPRVLVTTVSGEQHQGTLTRCNSSKVDIDLAESTIAIPANELLGLEVISDETTVKPNQIFVGLVDGSKVPIESIAVKKRQAIVESTLLSDSARIPASTIAWIELRPLGDEAHTYLRNVLEEGNVEDSLIVQKGEPPQFDHLLGMLGDISADSVRFVWDAEEISVKRSKLAAVTYYHSQNQSLPIAECVVTTRSGAELVASSINYHHFASPEIDVTLVCGLELQVSFDELVSADFSTGKIIFLSSLEPLRQEWTPLVGIPDSAELIRQYGLPRRNQSFNGSALTLAWPANEGNTATEIRPYQKGLALRSRSTIEYRIPKGIATFHTLAGIDPQSADQGNVRLEISADKTKLWEGEIDGNLSPVEISLDIATARKLKITVDYGKNLDYGDRIHLADARLIKAE